MNDNANNRQGYDTIKNLYDVNNVNRPGYDTVANLYGVKKEESSAVQNPEKEIKNEESNQRPGYDTIKNLYDVNNVNRPGYDTIANLYDVDQRKIFADIDKKMKKEYENILMTEDLSNTSQTFDAIAAGLGVDRNTLIEYVKYKKEQAKKKANLNKDVSVGKDDKSKVESADINSLINRLREINKLIEIDWDKNFTLEINRERKQIIEQLKKLNVSIQSIEGSKNNDKEEKISEKSKEEATKKYPELSPEDTTRVFEIYSKGEKANEELLDIADKYHVTKNDLYEMYKSSSKDKENSVTVENPSKMPRDFIDVGFDISADALKESRKKQKKLVSAIQGRKDLLENLKTPVDRKSYFKKAGNFVKKWLTSLRNMVYPIPNTPEYLQKQAMKAEKSYIDFANDENNEAIDKLISGVSEQDLINKTNVR